MTTDSIRAALQQVPYPGFSRDIVSFGIVKDIVVDNGDVKIEIVIQTKDPSIPQRIHDAAKAAIESLDGVKSVVINFDIKNPAQGPTEIPGVGQSSLPGVKKVFAVASGKGGVGKSTVASNLAAALARTQPDRRIGICDCDLYGPSIGLMLGTNERPMATEDNEIIPIRKHGLQLMSMAFLLEEDSPVIVRGPLATRYIQQFLRQVKWDELDYLILDLPPGTGDIQLTIVQTVALDGAIIVTTPQEVALIDARKASNMFAKVQVPVLGIVENMSYFECPSDGVRYPIFGEGGGQKEADRLGVPLLSQIPIELPIREGGDHGHPIALSPEGKFLSTQIFLDLARKVAAACPIS